ncbi:SDR family NAD(P)-dependent oxidoreductase [Planococcus lenghuensis]|uniref:Ketoreductase domain-containing protein n=1 Tax=Planococcus lenghuensis TaxID=2213202 RepID=A0A1Q2KXV7_9BACL|nr:SDR family NAD(P)-dependent oxidoreductase [Planococcus lenghuensis]AQQ53055.1 hypothetical protein B0X71_08085 [Planococcus lenghuensis]
MPGRKTVLVTGATGGIGKALALQLLAAGHRVIAAGRSETELGQLAAAGAETIQADFRHSRDTDRLLASLPVLDAVVFGAGIGFFQYAETQAEEEMRDTFEVNVLSVMTMTGHLLKTNPGIHLIYIASLAGKVATPKASVYAASKHALLGYASAVRMETEGRAVVTVVNTGPVDTGFLDLADTTGRYRQSAGRFLLKPETVARKIVSVLEQPVREVNLPRLSGAGAKLHQLLPRLSERFGRRFFDKK